MNGIPLATIGLAFGVLMVAIAIVASISGAPGFVIGWLSAVGILAIAGTVFERVRYKPLGRQPPGVGFAATEERFRDRALGAGLLQLRNRRAPLRRDRPAHELMWATAPL
jgi:hypothetical protein